MQAYELRRGPGKVDGAAPGCGGDEELALDWGGVLGGVCAWGLEGVEEDIAAVWGGGSCELLGGGVGGWWRGVGASGERPSAEQATSQTAGARAGGSYV